jgi:hypothetical protein
MIKVTLEFPSLEHMILAMGKMAGVPAAQTHKVDTAPVQAAAASGASSPAEPATPAIKQRKPRADRGQKRGEYAPREQNEGVAPEATVLPEQKLAEAMPVAAAPSPETATAQPTLIPAPSNEGAEAASVAVPTLEDVQKKLETLFNNKGVGAAMGLLQEFGVQRVRELPEEKRAAFIKATDEKLDAK